MSARHGLLAGLLCCGLSGCAGHGYFYYPTAKVYDIPYRHGLEAETVRFPSLDDTALYGYLFRAEGEPQGTVVFFHGNHGNVTEHFSLATFLLESGFDVLAFDYRGFGASEGVPTPAGTIRDGLAAVRYARSRARDSERAVGVFGQSLGGAIALEVAAREGAVRGAVIESTFTSSREIAAATLRRSWILRPLARPLARLMLSRGYEPQERIGFLSPRPVLLIHGDRDSTIPSDMAERLLSRASEPKALWVVKGAGHLGCRKVAGKDYEDRIAGFFARAFSAH
ncbi:alpha/beta hydrolase [Elusimicrobiota bacterium]